MSWLLVFFLVGAPGLLLLGWLLHRFCIRLEEAGYLYYRNGPKRPSGGVGFELDRLVRPSAQHVIEVEEQNVADSQDGVDGD